MNAWRNTADWAPCAIPGSRTLVAGASGGIGRALVDLLLESRDVIIGAHHHNTPLPVEWDRLERILPLRFDLCVEEECKRLIDEFYARAGGIDALVILCGGLLSTAHWREVKAEEWNADLALNLSVPFFLARAAFERMAAAGGGRIILTGTESALHGGGNASFAYGVAKMGTECMVRGMAREGAGLGILVNGIRMGFIRSGFHQRWKGSNEAELAKRAELVPLKRGGTVWEAAGLIAYLLSDWAGFITGQMLPLTGGDWF